MRKAVRLLSLSGINAIPGAGFLLAGWSGTTALLLYWWETFFGALLLLVLYRLYRRRTRGRGDAPGDAEFKASRSKSVGNTLVFTIAQAYFVGAIVVSAAGKQGTPLF